MALNKKRSLYANDTDGRALDALSKAALIDIVVEFMRCDTDDADIALTADEVSQNNRIKAILAARGDRPLQSAAQIAAKAAKTAKQDALLAAHHARLRAEWERARADMSQAPQGEYVELMQALDPRVSKAAKITAAEAHAKAFPFGAQRDARKARDSDMLNALDSALRPKR